MLRDEPWVDAAVEEVCHVYHRGGYGYAGEVDQLGLARRVYTSSIERFSALLKYSKLYNKTKHYSNETGEQKY